MPSAHADRMRGALARREQTMKTQIGLLCEVTNGNLGNAAFEAAAIQHLRDYFPDAKFFVCSYNSLETFKSDGVALFPINKTVFRTLPGRAAQPPRGRLSRLFDPVVSELAFWLASYRFIKDFRVLVLCGGGQLSDWWGGPWAHPYRLFMWTVLARLRRVPLIVLNVAVEAVDSPISRWFLRHTLRYASYRSFRDDASKAAVESWGVRFDNHVYPDLAFSLRLPAALAGARPAPHGRLVGISPMAYCDPRAWPVKDAARYRQYLRTLAGLAGALIGRGYTIMLFTSQTRMDRPVLEDLRAAIIEGDPSRAQHVTDAGVRTVDDFLHLMPCLDFVVASRMHGLLLAQLMETPVLAISYDSKVDSLMAGLGLAEFCLDIRTVELPSLLERFAALETRRSAVVATLQMRVTAYRAVLQAQYDAVFAARGDRVAAR